MQKTPEAVHENRSGPICDPYDRFEQEETTPGKIRQQFQPGA
jgi:hypothetical protein